MKLDYTSLNLPVTAADVLAYKNAQSPQGMLKNKVVIYIVLFVFASLLALPLLIQIVSLSSSGGIGAAMPPIILTAMIALVAAAVIAYLRYDERRRAKLYRFAVLNQLLYEENSAYTAYKGMIFDEGHSRVIKQLLRFADNSEIGNYQYETGSGRNRSTHTYGYVKIPLTRNLPHMVLDGKANNLFGIITGMTDSFDRSQKLSLEGNFDKYFTLYAPKQYERDALYVFTPDVMAVLIDEGKRYDMEIVDNELYIYSTKVFDLVSETQLSSLVRIVETIGSELRSQTKRYTDERILDSRGSNIVAKEGKRLRKGVNILALVVIGIIALNFASSILDSMGKPIGAYLYAGIGLIIVVAICVRFLSRIKLR